MMVTGSLAKRLFAASVLALCVGQAQAATYELNLFGTVSAGSYFSYDSGSTHYDGWSLSLSGLDSANAITVAVGDTIKATITFDHSFTIPASVDTTWMQLNLGGSTFPSVDTGTVNDALAFVSGGVGGLSGTDSNCWTTGSFASCNLFSKPNNPSITFDQVITSFDVAQIGTKPGQTAMLDNAQFGYYLFSPAPVPEPETYAMMMVGLGLIGVAARRRKSRQQ